MFDDDFKMLGRSAIVISPKQPFLDWIMSHEPVFGIDEELKRGEVFLLPDLETVTRMENWLKKNYHELFEEMLFGWYTEESTWPPGRNFKMFKEWFEYSLHPMVFDTQKGFIEKI